MIEDISVSINFYGDKFSPHKAEEVTGLVLSNKIEFGDIGLRVKYKGKPVSYGSGMLKVPQEINMHERILWLTNALSDKVDTVVSKITGGKFANGETSAAFAAVVTAAANGDFTSH
jgi:hypothetical protein